jgi:hypothetical protein
MKAGDICTCLGSNQSWAFFWILQIDQAPRIPERIFSLRKFKAQTKHEVLESHLEDVEELKGIELLGHFPIVENRVTEVQPRVIGSMPVTEEALTGYQIWREAFDQNQAGVFTLALNEL